VDADTDGTRDLAGLTPYEHICKAKTSEPRPFILDPVYQMPGLNIQDAAAWTERAGIGLSYSSGVRPTDVMPATAATTSLSEVSPVTPTAPTMAPRLSRTRTPPGTGTT